MFFIKLENIFVLIFGIIKGLGGVSLKKIIFPIWILLFLISILYLFGISFVSTTVQNIYYGVYFLFSFIFFFLIKRKSEFRINQLFIIFINLLAIILILIYGFLGVPLLLIYPILYSRKSNWISIILAGLTYFVAIVALILVMFIKLEFSSVKLVEEVKSSDLKYKVSMYLYDGGALGGNTQIFLDRNYLNIFKYRKTVFIGGYGADKEIKWLDDESFYIDEHIINVDTKKIIQGN